MAKVTNFEDIRVAIQQLCDGIPEAIDHVARLSVEFSLTALGPWTCVLMLNEAGIGGKEVLNVLTYSDVLDLAVRRKSIPTGHPSRGSGLSD